MPKNNDSDNIAQNIGLPEYFLFQGQYQPNPWKHKVYSLEDLQQLGEQDTPPQDYCLQVVGHAEPEDIKPWFAHHDVPAPTAVCIHFETFRDGRGYSLAKMLHREHWFTADLLCSGDILVDQIFYLWRCGFEGFVLRQDQSVELAQKALKSFEHVYQPSAQLMP